eukprot:gene6660-9141_t
MFAINGNMGLGSTSRDSSIGMLSSATEPKMGSKLGKFAHHSGRKLKSAPNTMKPNSDNNAQVAGGGSEDKVRISINNSSLEEIDHMLEEDALALLNIKKEIEASQNAELNKLVISLISAKKEYDALKASNEQKEKELNNSLIKFRALKDLQQATSTSVESVKSTVDVYSQQIAEINDDFQAEQRTIKMQTLMIRRLESEITAVRVETSKAFIGVEQAKHDYNIVDQNLVGARQELLDEEGAYEKLIANVKLRKEQREGKINMLHSIAVDGEQSITRLQQSLAETGKVNKSGATTARRTTKSSKMINQQILTNKPEQDEEDIEDESEVSQLAKRLDAPQLREIIQRYQSQTSRVEKLKQLDEEYKINMTNENKLKNELSEHLASTMEKIEQLASNRQIYQEVDLKDSALAATGKECEDWKDKSVRMKANIESLKQSIPRFLTKVTKIMHPKPTENQLNDAIFKLEDELTKLIKAIGSSLLKDATPDDLALLSQQTSATSAGVTNDSNSEFARLQRLPGFSRLQRQLYFNLMTAKPDISDQNIRIDNYNNGNKKNMSKRQASSAGMGGMMPPRNSNNNTQSSPRNKKFFESNMNNASGMINNNMEISNVINNSIYSSTSSATGMNDDLLDSFRLVSNSFVEEEPNLDRATIKSISKLIYDRDHHHNSSNNLEQTNNNKTKRK